MRRRTRSRVDSSCVLRCQRMSAVKIVILTATSAWGGVEVHAVGLAQLLGKRRHQVTIVQLGHLVYSQSDLELSGNIQVASVYLRKPLEELTFCETLEVLKPFKADVIVFEKGELDSGNFYLDVAAKLYARRYITIEQLSCVSSHQEPSPHARALFEGFEWWRKRTVLKRWSRGLVPDAVGCVGEAVRRPLIDRYRFRSGKAISIANGIEPSRFQMIPEARRRVRAQWGIPVDAFVFGAVGRLAAVKGYEIALDGFRKVIRQFPDGN